MLFDISVMSDYDSEVFYSGDEDSDIYSHCDETRHVGAAEYSASDPADSSATGPLNSSQDGHEESNGSSRNFILESPMEMWDSDNSSGLHFLEEDSDRSESPMVADNHYDSTDPDDEILAEATHGLRESHFQLLCEGSEVTFIEGMILIFQ